MGKKKAAQQPSNNADQQVNNTSNAANTTTQERMSPLSDSVFNFMFQDDSMKVSMCEIINAVLKEAGDAEIDEVKEIKTQYTTEKHEPRARAGRLDVRAKAVDGTLFNIEVQLRRMNAMNARSWFYANKIMNEEFKEGQPYSAMPKVRVINILGFVLREDHPDFIQPIRQQYTKGTEEAMDVFRVYNIELPKYRKEHPTLESVKGNPLKSWLYLLDKGYETNEEMEMLGNMTEGMRAFAKRYRISLTDPELKRLYDLEMSAERDRAEYIYGARQEGEQIGIEKGIAKGVEQQAIKTATNMILDNEPEAKIMRYSGLNLDQVRALREKLEREGRIPSPQLN